MKHSNYVVQKCCQKFDLCMQFITLLNPFTCLWTLERSIARPLMKEPVNDPENQNKKKKMKKMS